MFGTYQSSCLRVELSAGVENTRASLTQVDQLEKWLWPQQIKLLDVTASPYSKVSTDRSELLIGRKFQSRLGPVSVTHEVEVITDGGVRFLLSGGIDGFHEWQWGDGWVQSRLEGVSLLPLNLGQTLSLARLKQYLQRS